MPSPSVDTMWQEIRMLKARVCELETIVGVLSKTSSQALLQFVVGEPVGNAIYSRDKLKLILPQEGEYEIQILDNIKKDSITMFWENMFFPSERVDRESNTVRYDKIVTIITRQPSGYPFINGQLYTLTYEYI